MIPWLTRAQVVSTAPPNKVNVIFPSGQSPGFPVQVLTEGPADAQRVQQEPLPRPGTWGIIGFPNGDSRNGVWLGSYYANQEQAYTIPDDPHFRYFSHWSGHYETLDKDGNSVTYHPDGTYVAVGSMTALPSTNRQTVDATQTQQSVPFPASDRIPNPPSPFYVTIAHASGATLQITPAGQINVIAAPGQTINFSQEGQTVNDALVLVSKFISEFNAHTHGDPQGGTTTTPTAPLTAADVESAITKTSG